MSDWQRIQSIFLATADIPFLERDHVLGELCGGDLELRYEVESLLFADSGSAMTIDSAIRGVASTIIETPALIGERLGVYRIVREIGRGGMGSVYLARRDDEEYTKDVALKVVKRGMNTPDVLRRFREERQILANLDHPYIARLFDGGTSPEGISFFAMEYVEGRPVDVFCRENSLDLKARCRLFLYILEAVGYAHQNLVIHGDLKPANIFVTSDGTPKLLDFGVAKLMDIEGNEEHDANATRIFTPGYASPEQVRWDTVTTATDIYSLGAVLYELLSGKRSQPVDFDTPTMIERAVCDIDIVRPGFFARELPADLDHVVLMALRKKPEQRYQSAGQFAEDIRRCLEGRPVLARPNTVGYLVRKFVTRNWAEVAIGAAVAAALIVGLVVSLAQTRRAEAERAAADSQRRIALQERAQAEAAQASEARQRAFADEQRSLALKERDEAEQQKKIADERLKDIVDLAGRTLFDVHTAVASLPGSIPARKAIVQTTLDYLKSMETNVGANDNMREVLAEAYYKVALIQGDPHGPSLQDSASAERTLKQAEAVLLPAYRRNPKDAGLMLRLIEVKSAESDLIYRSGRVEEAAKIYVDLLPVTHRLFLTKPCKIECETQEMAIETTLASELLSVDPAKALAYANHASETGRELIVRHPTDTNLKQALGVVTAVAAAAYKSLGDLVKAGQNYRQSIEIREQLLQDDPANVQIRRNLLVAYGNYATTLGVPTAQNLGQPAEARLYAIKGVEIARETVKGDPQDATARRDLGMILGRLGMIDPAPGEVAESLGELRESASLIEPLVIANPKSFEAASALADILEYQGRRLAELNKTAEAVQSYRKSMALLEPFISQPSPGMLVGYIGDEEDLALLYATTGDKESALDMAGKAIAAAEKYVAVPPMRESRVATLASAWSTLALTQASTGSPDLARQTGEKAMKIWESIHNTGLLTPYRDTLLATRTLLGQTH